MDLSKYLILFGFGLLALGLVSSHSKENNGYLIVSRPFNEKISIIKFKKEEKVHHFVKIY